MTKCIEPSSKTNEQGSVSALSRTTKPIYPTHPFSPDLCAVISKLPHGFSELALTGTLSVQLIHRLEVSRSAIVHLMATATNEDADHDWQTLLHNSEPFERMVWLTLLVSHLRSSTYEANCKALAEAVLDCASFSRHGRAEAEWLLWASLILIAAPDPDRVVVEERQQVINMVTENYEEASSWDRLEAVAQKFLWNDTLSTALRSSLGYETV